MFWRDRGFLDGSDGKESPCNVGDPDSIPGSGRSPGGGNSFLLQYSCLENPMDGGTWWAAVHGVAKSWTWLKRLSTHLYFWLHLQAFSCFGEQGLFYSCRVGFSLWRVFLLQSTGCRPWGLSCCLACEIFPGHGSNLCALYCKADSYTRPPRKSQKLATFVWTEILNLWPLNISQTQKAAEASEKRVFSVESCVPHLAILILRVQNRAHEPAFFMHILGVSEACGLGAAFRGILSWGWVGGRGEGSWKGTVEHIENKLWLPKGKGWG